MKKYIRDTTPNTAMALAVKRSAGSDVTSVGGMVALLCVRHAGVPDPTLGRKHKEVFNLQSSKSLILLSYITHFSFAD